MIPVRSQWGRDQIYQDMYIYMYIYISLSLSFIWYVAPGCLVLIIQWIGLRENLQETMVFTMKYGVFL